MMEIRLKLTFLENLFLCLCLLTGLGQANGSADVTVIEGSEAVLPCFIKPEQNIERDAFVWEKYRQKVFLYKNGNHSNNGLPGQDEQFKGRVSHFPDQLQFGDASIRIRDTKLSDSGTYRCDFSPDELNRQIFYIKLVVDCIFKDRWEENIGGASLKPHITIFDQSRDEAKLQCDVRRVSPKPKVKWQDSSGKILPAEEPQVAERRDRYDIILQTTVTKTDRYRCVVTQEEICHQVSAETSVFIHGPLAGWIVAVVVLVLVVLLAVILYKYYKKGADFTTGETSELFVTAFKADDWALLQCEVQGVSPKPKVEWQDSSGNILPAEEPQVTERGGKYFIILNTTVRETDQYRCVVKQKGICHQDSEEISVKIPVITDPEPSQGEASKLSVRIFKTKDGARLWCEAQGASPEPELEWKDSSGNILPVKEPEVIEREGNFIILNTTVTKTGKYRCVVTQEGIEDQTKAEIFVFIPGACGVFWRRFFWLCSFCNRCKKHSQTERNGNQDELVELNRNPDTSAV